MLLLVIPLQLGNVLPLLLPLLIKLVLLLYILPFLGRPMPHLRALGPARVFGFFREYGLDPKASLLRLPPPRTASCTFPPSTLALLIDCMPLFYGKGRNWGQVLVHGAPCARATVTFATSASVMGQLEHRVRLDDVHDKLAVRRG